jgi:hypothetical protein
VGAAISVRQPNLSGAGSISVSVTLPYVLSLDNILRTILMKIST